MASRSVVVPFMAGVLGGGLVTGAILALVAASGWSDSSTKTITVQEVPVVPVNSPRQTPRLTARQVYERDSAGVVFLSATGVSQNQSVSEFLKGEGGQQGTATGSGFEIDGHGTILTNWHVVESATSVIVGLEHGKAVTGKVIGKDSSNDIAVLRIPIDGLTLHPLMLGESSAAHVGDPVLAIGNPFGLDRTLTTGVVSALQRQIKAPDGFTINNVLQTDAPINPGSSGGPLLNSQGQVIGINSQIVTSGSSGGNVGIAFAIPIDAAKSELTRLEGSGAAHRG
jgi:S1-C subfamily serine protease